MDEDKVTIIIYQTANGAIESVRQSIESLNAPDGVRVETKIVGGENRWRAYNLAMKSSDAKYKIYLDDRTVVTNRDMLSELLEIFRADETIGAIGVSGAIVLSTNGSTYRSANRYGRIHIGGTKNPFGWGNLESRYVEVEALDGFMIATQHDVDWRDDLFDENSFGDAAQCLELRRKGYKSVVVRQEEPWLWYRADSTEYHETCRRKFLLEYSKELYPQVQVLIPTFNRPKFFVAALESALNQTYRNIEIIVSDDSTNEETYAAIRPYLDADARIKYFRNPGFTAKTNGEFLIRYWKEHPEAEYYNWLNDDDLFYPTKLEVMVEVYRNNPDVSIVSSKRHNIDASGKIIGHMEPLHDKTAKLLGSNIAKYILLYTANRIGEPSTVLVRKKFLADEDKDFWRNRTKGERANALGDYSQWLYLLERGNLYWIDEYLSARRVHDGQDSNQIGTWVTIYINFAEEVNEFWRRRKFIETEAELRQAIIVWLTKAASALQRAFLEHYEGIETRMIERVIPAMVNALNNGGNIKFPSWPKK